MEISSNLNLDSVSEASTPKRPKAAAKGEGEGDTDRVTFTDMTSVQQALENSPNSRSEAVARARQLIADPNYPGPDVTSRMSQFLAGKLAAESE